MDMFFSISIAKMVLSDGKQAIGLVETVDSSVVPRWFVFRVTFLSR